MSIVQKVFFIENMSEDDVYKINTLLETGSLLNFKINAESKSITITGTNDELYNAKQIVKSEGYNIL